MLDGFSFINLGAEQKLTSAEMAFNAERIAKQGKDRNIEDIDKTSKGKSSIRKEDLTEKEGGGYSLGGDSSGTKKTEEDDDTDLDDNDSLEVEKESKFVVILNKETNMLELIETNTNTVVQTISPEELSGIASKMSNPSGIIVNKKI